MKYAIYLRCSTDDQSQGDYTTIDAQRQIVQAYVAERGGEITGEYCDEGRTGTNLKRPGWIALLKAAKSHAFGAVVCTYMSRLGRGDAGVVAEYLLRETGVSLELVQESFTADMAGRVHKQVTRLVDSLYVEQVRDWTITKMEAMARTGQYTGGPPPFGYTVTPDAVGLRRLVPSPDADTVRCAFDLFLQTRSIARVVEYLRTMSDRRWVSCTARNLLTNERYTGVSRFRDVVSEHPAIIPVGIFAEAATILAENSRSRTREPRQDAYAYHLRGLVWCPHCESNYTQGYARSRGRTIPYYVCNSHNHGDARCPVVRVNADKLHASLAKEIGHAAAHWTVMRRLIAESPNWTKAPDDLIHQRGAVGKRLQFLDAREVNLTGALADGRATDAIYNALEKIATQRAELSAEQARLSAEIANATVKRPTPHEVMDAWGRFGEVWGIASTEHKTELFQTLVDRVVMTEKGSAEAFVLTSANPGFALGTGVGAENRPNANHTLRLMIQVGRAA